MKKILIALLLISVLLLAGCAKRGEAQIQQNQTNQSGGSQEDQSLGDLFNIDTDKPAEAGGYSVPAAGEE